MQKIEQNDEALVREVLNLGDRLASKLARVPGHTVVAGIRSKSGNVHFGVNCDSIHGTCAEVVAYANAVMAGDVEVETVVATLIAGPDVGRILAPCGNCRQLFSEHAPDISVIVGAEGRLLKMPLSKLLPCPYKHL